MAPRGHAIVLGGGIAGMCHAAVLAKHFERVTVLESDTVSMVQVEHRSGVAQGLQLHALLKRGWNVFEKYLPGLTKRLLHAGATVGEFGPDIRWFMNGTWWSTAPTGFHGLGCTRPFLEFHLRARLLEEPNVTLRTEARVRGLRADQGKVIGVEFETRTTGEKEVLEAQLVVDCTGRNSKASTWLESLGYPAPAPTEVNIGITYVTQLVRLTKDPGFITCYIAADPPQQKRFGMLMRAEDGLSIFLVGSSLGERPPATREGMHAFAQTLSQPHIADAVEDAQTISQPIPYHFKSNLRRPFGSMKAFPPGFIVSGDATCSFNPIYGQGMTCAGIAAELLDGFLSKEVSLAALSRKFQKALDRTLDQPWMAALATDFQYPEVQGQRNAMLSFAGAYSKHVLRGMHHSAVQHRFLPVLNMTAGPAALFHPTLLGAALLSSLRIIKPQPAFPGRRDPLRELPSVTMSRQLS